MSTSSQRLSARMVWPLVCAGLMTGCANPILPVQGPGHALADSKAPSNEPASMEDALRKLNHQRASYYEAIREQTGRTQDAVTGLVWLGAAAIGFAPHVHKDVLITGGLVGGTTYGLSVAQLTKRRIDVWQAGIDALDCAREAVIPLQLSDADAKLLGLALKDLTQTRMDLLPAHAALAAMRARKGYAANKHDADVQPLLQAAEDALPESAKALKAGRAALRASRGIELSSAVNRISAKVTQVMGDVALQPEDVKNILSNLPGYVDIFTPGVLPKSVEKAATPNAALIIKGQGDPSFDTEVAQKAEQLRAALAVLVEAQQRISALIGDMDIPTATAAIRACAAKNVSPPLTLTKATLEFTKGQSAQRLVDIQGGNKPYQAKWQGGMPAGLAKDIDGSVLVVTATDQVAVGDARIEVSDNSDPQKTVLLPVSIAAAASAPAATGGTTTTTTSTGTKNNAVAKDVKKEDKKDAAKDPKMDPKKDEAKPEIKVNPIAVPGGVSGAASASVAVPAGSSPATGGSDAEATEAAWRALEASLPKGSTRAVNGVPLTVVSAQARLGRLFVRLSCGGGSPGVPAADVRKVIEKSAPAAVETLRKGNAVDAKLSQIDLKGSIPCVRE